MAKAPIRQLESKLLWTFIREAQSLTAHAHGPQTYRAVKASVPQLNWLLHRVSLLSSHHYFLFLRKLQLFAALACILFYHLRQWTTLNVASGRVSITVSGRWRTSALCNCIDDCVFSCWTWNHSGYASKLNKLHATLTSSSLVSSVIGLEKKAIRV